LGYLIYAILIFTAAAFIFTCYSLFKISIEEHHRSKQAGDEHDLFVLFFPKKDLSRVGYIWIGRFRIGFSLTVALVGICYILIVEFGVLPIHVQR